MKRFTGVLSALLLAAALFMVSSCDGFLEDPGPVGSLNAETFYRTPDEFRSAIYASYAAQLNFYYQQFGRGWYQGMTLPSDDVMNNPNSVSDIDAFNWKPSGGSGVGNFWSQSYEGIAKANLVLRELKDAPISEEKKASFRGEARFLRGYYHFLLARLFGNPPIVKSYLASSIDSINVGNQDQSPEDVYNFIEADFKAAMEQLPAQREDMNSGRVVSGTAAAYLGKTHLFHAQWFDAPSHYEDAVSALEAVVNSGTYGLLDNYESTFEIPQENGKYSLYEIQNQKGGQGFTNPWLPPDFGALGADGNARHISFGAAGGVPDDGVQAPGANVQGYGVFFPTEPLRDAFETYEDGEDRNDPRRFSTYFLEGETYSPRECNVPASYTGEGSDTTEVSVDPCPFLSGYGFNGATFSKYMRPFEFLPQPPLFTNNERIMRYADVLLMLAEAELLGNGNAARAAELVNRVRSRARSDYEFACSNGAVNLACDDSTVTQDDVLPPVEAGNLTHADIRYERRVELATEGKRYNDLARWHRAGLIDIPFDIDFGSGQANENWTEQNLLRPIPQTRLDNNTNLVQNSRYD